MAEKKKALIFGEIVWDDVIPGGGSQKPENIGGASFNVAVHLRRLGMESVMLSALGNDALGEKTRAFVERSGVNASYVTRSGLPTCLITVTFNEAGEPRYTIPPEVSWDQITVADAQMEQLKKESFDVFYFGTLHQRSQTSRETLHKIFHQITCEHRYCDVNLRPPFYNAQILDRSLSESTIVKMNDQEIAEVLRLTIQREEPDLKRAMNLLLQKYELKTLIVTCGEKGALWMTPKASGFSKGRKVQVTDTVGAGDGFSAGFINALCNGRDVEAACEAGNKMGAFIATKKSSIPAYEREELENWL